MKAIRVFIVPPLYSQTTKKLSRPGRFASEPGIKKFRRAAGFAAIYSLQDLKFNNNHAQM
jgi:hypothetical protein